MTPSKANIQAARNLVKRYREITIDDITKGLRSLSPNGYLSDERGSYIGRIQELLTGFGRAATCPLCISTTAKTSMGLNCSLCIYSEMCGCRIFSNRKTYDTIKNASTPTTLRNAYRKRADHIEKILNNL